jgi:glycosyltransferase involved in cell wall biosynthesis
LFAAWKLLRDEFPSARLLLVGPWEEENAVSAVCRQGFLADPRVIVAGTQDDVAPFYQAMDVFVFPSHGTEGFPNAPMEAAAMALPVVATRVVGCVDAVVHDVTGQLISARATEELAAAVRRYLNDPELRRRHGQAGRARVKNSFAPRQLWAEFAKFYDSRLREVGLPVPTLSVPQRDPHRQRDLPDAA